MWIRSRKGEFSVKGLALTVAAIVVIGFIMTWIMATGGGFETVWGAVWGWIQSFMGP
jgi:hypothetical protein